MSYLKISIGIFAVLAASRFVPHPPNFTSLLALSFYVPALLGKRFIPSLLVSFAITDLIIGFHSTTVFTWGSVLIIGFLANYFNRNLISRVSGSFIGGDVSLYAGIRLSSLFTSFSTRGRVKSGFAVWGIELNSRLPSPFKPVAITVTRTSSVRFLSKTQPKITLASLPASS